MKNKYIIISLTVLAFGLQSCFVAKKYQESQIEIADKYRDVATDDSTTLASMPWEQLFTDSYLQDLIHKALDNNLDYLMAIERVKAAEAYYKQGKMAYLPSFQINANGGSYQLSENSATGVASGGSGLDYESYQLTGSISWEADIWGKIRSSKRASQAKYLQSEASQRAVKSALVAHLTSAYFQLIALDAQVEVVKKTVSNRIEGLATMTSLKDAGIVTEAAVKQTEAQLYSTQILLLNLEKNVKLLENTISLLLGQHSGSIARGKLDDQTVMAELKTGFPSQLLRNRPDVMFAEYGLMNAFELTNVARSNFYPSISINANGGLESILFDSWFNSTSLFSNVIANISQPLFNKRSIRTKYEVAKAQQAEARYNFKNTVLRASKEVSDALYNYQTERKKYKIQKQELQALTLAVSHSEELLNNGYQNTTYLEVLTARSNALSSEMSTIDSKFQQLNAIVELYLALGGGWK